MKPVIAGNWKMNKTVAEALAFARGLREALPAPPEAEVVIAPPFTAIHPVARELAGSCIKVAGQDLHEAQKGAYTGEVSGEMLREAGCSLVIVGHSERRTLFGEGDAVVNAKLKAALRAGLRPIFCLGESLAQREEGRTKGVIAGQLKEGLNNITADDIGGVVVAYEPIWAIGTGRTATPDQAQEIHRFIREWLSGAYGSRIAAAVPILYGGSVTPQNIAGLRQQPDIDGALVGGASLEVDSFVSIIRGGTQAV